MTIKFHHLASSEDSAYHRYFASTQSFKYFSLTKSTLYCIQCDAEAFANAKTSRERVNGVRGHLSVCGMDPLNWALETEWWARG